MWIFKLLSFLTFVLTIYNFIVSIMFFIFVNNSSTSCSSSKNSTSELSDFYRNILIYLFVNLVCADIIFLYFANSFLGIKDLEGKLFRTLISVVMCSALLVSAGFSLYFYRQLNKDTKIKCSSTNKKYISLLEKLLLSSGIISIIIVAIQIIILLVDLFTKYGKYAA